MMILDINDDDFAAMLRGEAYVRAGLTQAPGGVDEPEVLAHVRRLAANLHRSGFAGGHWMMVESSEVVGLCGFKAPPSRDGEVELGFGVAASRRNRGHASAAIGAVLEVARRCPAMRTIVAMTAVGNIASQCVLKRNGFERIDTREDSKEILWRRRL